MARRAFWRVALYTGAVLPLLLIAGRLLTPGREPDPVGAIVRGTGRAGLAFLLASLIPSAARSVTGSGALLPLRRFLGLAAYSYAALHLLSHIAFGFGAQLGLFLQSLRQDRFVLVGLAAFSLLTPLAITSTARWQRWLGVHWRRLHRLSYLAAALAVWHYGWAFKEWRYAPLMAGVLLGLLLAARLIPSVNSRRS